MSKLYGYLQGNSKEVTRSGTDFIESKLQTSFTRTNTFMTNNGYTYINTYQCHGNDNVGEHLAEIIISPNGEVTVLKCTKPIL